MNICIYGASSEHINCHFFQQAEELGQQIAEHGHTLVFGAGDNGLMGACARGTQKFGGRIVGISPCFFDQPGIIFQGCTELIFTQTMRERKQAMEDRSDAFIVLPGGIGTFEEFFEILTLKQLGRTSKPIILFNIDGFFAPLISLLEMVAEQGFMSSNCFQLITVCGSALEAIDSVENPKKLFGNLNRLQDYSL